MWPSGQSLVPHPAALPLPQNSGGNPELPSQQGAIFTNYVPYLDQALPMPFLQQGSGVHWPQDPMVSDMVLRDHNWLWQDHNRRESTLEYQNGEVVMVRCNQQKWLCGTIQRMSTQGLRIWIADANILVNVPLVLVPTHVLKISMYSELQGALQPHEPMWMMAITDSTGCRKALLQCVRPAHLSHRQLFHKFGCIECALCKTTVSSIDMVSPWNCSHQVHSYCLQLRMQHSFTSDCPSCIELGISQSSSPSDHSTLQVMPSTFVSIEDSTTQVMRPMPSTSNALQHQQWLDLQCVCGFRGSIDSVCIGNMDVAIFCPNCHRPVNMIQSGEKFASMSLPRAYSEVDREILQRSLQEQGFGYPMESFSNPRRLAAIEEGSGEGICSTPPSPKQSEKELEDRPSYFPSYLVDFGEFFKNNTSDPDVATSMQPSPGSRSSLQGGVFPAASPTPVILNQKGKSSVRNSLQDGVVLTATSPTPVILNQKEKSSARNSLQDGVVLTATSPTQVTLNQKGKSSVRSSLQDGVLIATTPTQATLNQKGKPNARSSLQDEVLTATSPTQATLNQKGKPNARNSLQDEVLTATSPTQVTSIQIRQSSAQSSLHDGTVDAPSPTQVTPIQNEQSSDRSSHQDGSLYALSSTLIQDEESKNNAPSPTKFLIHPAASTHVNHVKLPEVQEANESSEKALEIETPSLSAPHRQSLWRRVSEVDWTRRSFDEDTEDVEGASYSNDFAAVAPPSAPPVYVNHFENFVKLAMASASTAKEILAGASASPSSSATDPAPWKPAPWVTPAPALVTPAPAIISPPRAFFSRAPEAPALLTEGPEIVTPARAFFSRGPVLVAEPGPALVTDGAIVTPARALFSRAAGLITEPPAWVTNAKEPNGSADASPAWITVIKDGVDSRKDDAKQWEMDRVVRQKEAEFL